MQFSDTTNKNGLVQMCEDLTALGDGGISGNSTLLKKFTARLNRAYHKAVSIILEAQDDWDFDDSNHSDYPVATTPMVAGQRDYTFPASLKVLKIKRVDITYDGSSYVRAHPFDTQELDFGLGNDTLTDARFSASAPGYKLISNSVQVYPEATAAQVAAVAKVRVEFLREVDEFTSSDTTQEPGFDELFHPYLAVEAALDWAVSNDLARASSLGALLADWEARMRAYFGRKNEDRVSSLSTVYSPADYT